MSGKCRGDAILFDWMQDENDVRHLDWYGAPRVYGTKPDMGWVSTKPVDFTRIGVQ